MRVGATTFAPPFLRRRPSMDGAMSPLRMRRRPRNSVADGKRPLICCPEILDELEIGGDEPCAPRQKERERVEDPLSRSPLGGLARPAETVVAGPCFFQPSLEDAPDDPGFRDAEEHRLCRHVVVPRLGERHLTLAKPGVEDVRSPAADRIQPSAGIRPRRIRNLTDEAVLHEAVQLAIEAPGHRLDPCSEPVFLAQAVAVARCAVAKETENDIAQHEEPWGATGVPGADGVGPTVRIARERACSAEVPQAM